MRERRSSGHDGWMLGWLAMSLLGFWRSNLGSQLLTYASYIWVSFFVKQQIGIILTANRSKYRTRIGEY